jgi:hypothetical protein
VKTSETAFCDLPAQQIFSVRRAALDDADSRLSRFFLMQTLLNAGFGVLIAIGLWVIGVPNAVFPTKGRGEATPREKQRTPPQRLSAIRRMAMHGSHHARLRCAVEQRQAFRSIRQSRRELPVARGVPPIVPCNDMFAGTHA